MAEYAPTPIDDDSLIILKPAERGKNESASTASYISSSPFVPKDKAAWMEYTKSLARKRTDISYLQEEYNYKNDPSLPLWYYWSKEELAEWLVKRDLSNLKEMFLLNNIDGRKLGLIDATALQKMGVNNFKDVNNAMRKIRRLQGVRYPNSMRAHYSRRIPYEEFLQFNWTRGKTYDLYTFQQFCLEMGYSTEDGIKPPLIPCTCPISISVRNPGNLFVRSDDSFGSKNSLDLAPTVEVLVRTIIVRDKMIDSLLQELLNAAFSSDLNLTNLKLEDSFHCKLAEAYDELGIENTELCALEQLNFTTVVAKEFLNEVIKTRDLLENIEELQQNIEQDVSPEIFREFANITTEFLERIAPTAALLGLMKVDLDLLLLTKELVKIEKSMYPQPEKICLDDPEYAEE